MSEKTQMPDAIWAWWFIERERDDVIKGGWDNSEDIREHKFLMSTPSREAADDMLEALEQAHSFIADQYGCAESQALQGEYVSQEARPVWDAICEAIAKAKGGAS